MAQLSDVCSGFLISHAAALTDFLSLEALCPGAESFHQPPQSSLEGFPRASRGKASGEE